jgi:diguanylate cyclase (GGDEF)-like protein
MSLAQLEPLFSEEFEIAGCYLVPSEVAQERLGIDDWEYHSELNGSGPHAWARHWLLVPLIEGNRWIGLIRVDDPLDRLLPTRARLQALRLFANQAVAAMSAANQTVRLRHEATHDALTSLPNRRAFLTRLAEEGASPEGFALVLCDMDDLKAINDSLGHEAGDQALVLLADALRSGLRRSDEAYRLGGDEFAVVLPGADRLDAERVTRRLREAVTASRLGPLERIEASFGIGVLEEGESPQHLVARVDAALYETKRSRIQAA